jgi:DnaJ-class molecular chaperone
MGKDYYGALGVDPGADQEEIRRAYRAKAFELHPDRNGGSREAEEAFKGVTEAYAVLGDPARRSAYDASLRGGTGAAFDASEAFTELFRHPVLGNLFSQLSREFTRHGLRFDETYLRNLFARRSRGVFFGGFVAIGPLGDLLSSLLGHPSRSPAKRSGRSRVTRRTSEFIGRFLRSALPKPRNSAKTSKGQADDVRFTLPVRGDVLLRGGRVRVRIPGPSGPVTYDVRIPEGAKPGMQLRLAGKGKGPPESRGDLLLEIRPSA